MRTSEIYEKRLDGTMGFTPEDVADGKLTRFIECLRENNCQMRIWTDGYCWVVDYLRDTTVADGINFLPVDFDNDPIPADGNE